jgi:SAM-dependent methyltransferase
MHKSFKEIFLNHAGHVSDKWINYLDIYDLYLKDYIGKEPNFLEIGIQNGGCIEIMSEYLVNGNIFGIDINPDILSLSLETHCKLMCFNASDPTAIEHHLSKYKFDIIIDDGSHKNHDIIASFKSLFHKLSPGGTYIIEDIQTSYWSNFAGGGLKNENSAISFFKSMIDVVNFFHVIRDAGVDQNFMEQNKEYITWIESLHFYDNVIIVKKLKDQKLNAYYRSITGDREKAINANALNTFLGYKVKYKWE